MTRTPSLARERAALLERFLCPDHGCDLEEWEDVDEHGARVWYLCPLGDHAFGSVSDGWGSYAPVDRDDAGQEDAP